MRSDQRRPVAPRVGMAIGQQFVIDYRGGAGGTIATAYVATAPGDGYTLLFDSSAHTSVPAVTPNLPFDTEKDFVPVALLTRFSQMLVCNAAVPATSVAELVALADELGILLAGPNGQGVVSTPASLCAQIVAPFPPVGRIAVASQSGNFVSSFLNYARQTGVGISRAVSAGNAAAVTPADYLDWYADDPATAVSLAYVEGIVDGRALLERFASVAARKPLVVIKGGATEGGARAAASPSPMPPAPPSARIFAPGSSPNARPTPRRSPSGWVCRASSPVASRVPLAASTA